MKKEKEIVFVLALIVVAAFIILADNAALTGNISKETRGEPAVEQQVIPEDIAITDDIKDVEVRIQKEIIPEDIPLASLA